MNSNRKLVLRSHYGVVGSKIANRKSQIANQLAGQAMVEFAVALIVIMILLAGLIQIGLLTRAHTETMMTARQAAAELAMADTYSGASDALYIFDWVTGPDAKHYTRDDYPFISTNVEDSIQDIIDVAHPDELASFIPDNAFSTLDASFYPVDEFFLVHGHGSDSITTFPIIRNLIYNRATISIESDVWLSWAQGGIY